MACPLALYNELPYQKLKLRGHLVSSAATLYDTALKSRKILLESLCLDSTGHQIVGQLNGRNLISVMVTETQSKSINAAVLCLIDTKMGDLIICPFDFQYRRG